jgi:hypothetical protein
MNRLVYGVGVDLTSAIPIQRFGDMLDEVGQSRLVVGSYEGARSLSLCLAAHGGHVTLANASGIGAGDGPHFVVRRASGRGPDHSVSGGGTVSGRRMSHVSDLIFRHVT